MRRMLSLACFAAVAVMGTLGVQRAILPVQANGAAEGANCQGLPTAATLQQLLRNAPGHGGEAGGLFSGQRMWGAVVNRAGEVCSYVTSTDDPIQVWPGSQAIAKSKAYTANAFSLDTLALSTARLYTFTQPGHSLWSLGQSNLFDASRLLPPSGSRGDLRQIVGGLIFFGGGVPLYSPEGTIIGGLGISGDTSCTDHEIAKRVRDLAQRNPPGGSLVDDIVYTSSVFAHPKCPNTWQNGVFVGNEAPAVY